MLISNMKNEKIQIKDGSYNAIYFGHVRNGKPDGKGYIRNGELDKFKNILWVNKKIIKKGIFKNGYLIKGKIQEFGKIIEGDFRNKEANVKGKLRYVSYNNKTNSEYFGEIKINKQFGYVPHGNGKLTKSNRVVSIGKFANGLLKKGKMYNSLKKKWEIFPNKDTIKFHQGNINKRLKKWKPY